MMGTDFARDFDSAGLRLANEPDASGGRDMLAVDVMIAKFGQENVAHDDDFFARRRPATQTEQRAPVALMDDSVSDKIVILAMIQDRQVHHSRVLDRAAHHLMILHTAAVVRNGDHTRLRE